MATVNPTTLLFEGLALEDICLLEAYADALMLKGTFTQPQPELITKWVEAAHNGNPYRDGPNTLLLMSTVLPGRIYCSLYRAVKANAGMSL